MSEKDTSIEKKVVISPGYSCNYDCIFCSVDTKRHLEDKPTAQVIREIFGARKRDCTYLSFVGGESTIRKDMEELISFGKHIGYNVINVTTNGLRFANEKVLDRYIEKGMNSVLFSLHGATAEIHDQLTGIKGSYKKIIKAIKLAHQKDIYVGMNSTLVKQNYKTFPELCQLMIDLGVQSSEFVYVDPVGAALENFDDIMPPLEEMSAYVKKGLDLGIKAKIPHWHIRYLPLCYLEGYQNYSSEWQDSFSNTEHIGLDFVNFDAEKGRRTIGKIKHADCKNCKMDQYCEGFWKKFVDRRGFEGLRVVR
jgi:MoaA/NifB/PqqE/SkfB family radical SAM enzyme